MERKTHSINKEFPFVKLYFNDLQRIIKILEDENFTNIVIETIDHQYEVSELSQIEDLSDLHKIQATSPFYFSLEFRRIFAGVELYVGNDSTLAEGIVQKIGGILHQRRRSFFSFITKRSIVLIMAIISVLSSGVLLFFNILNNVSYPLVSLVIIIIALFLMILPLGKICKTNIFLNYPKEDQQSFWKRNKDKILLIIISNILTALVTALITVIITLALSK